MSDITQRYERLARCSSLTELLLSAKIYYIAPVRFEEAALPNSSFDLFYSYSVLHRVPRDDLVAYLEVARDALRSSGYSYHVIHHTDHNARHDSSLGPLDYLRYEDRLYNLLQSRRFNYQNRMRHAEFLELFADKGFRTVCEEVSRVHGVDPDKLTVASRFECLPMDDVRIARTQIVSRMANAEQ